jgi:hypothetical protein
MPRRAGKSYKARALAKELNIPVVDNTTEPAYFRGLRRVIIDDLPEEQLLDMIHSNHPINLMEEVYYYRTFTQDPKNYFAAKIPRTWAITLEAYTREEL